VRRTGDPPSGFREEGIGIARGAAWREQRARTVGGGIEPAPGSREFAGSPLAWTREDLIIPRSASALGDDQERRDGDLATTPGPLFLRERLTKHPRVHKRIVAKRRRDLL